MVGDAIRPHKLNGCSGVIPKVKINYTEVAHYCSQTKDFSRDQCEAVFKFISGRVRKGDPVSVELPMVGKFLVRTRVAGVKFISDLVEKTAGVTAKQFTAGNIFASQDATNNLKIH